MDKNALIKQKDKILTTWYVDEHGHTMWVSGDTTNKDKFTNVYCRFCKQRKTFFLYAVKKEIVEIL